MSTKLKSYQFEVPEGVSVQAKGLNVTVRFGNKELTRELSKFVSVQQADKSVTVSALNKTATSRMQAGVTVSALNKTATSRMQAGSYASHVKNMVAGVQKPFVYKLKIIGTHFPININQTAEELSIQNFLGEKKPRKVKLHKDVIVKVNGDIVTVESSDIEKAGMIAARIEQASKVRGKDRRVFQDGIYIVEKAGEPILK